MTLWIIGQTTDNDLIGRPYWQDDHEFPSVDTGHPVVYTLLSHTRFNGENLLQLVYTIWFSGRTAESAVDTLAGHLDGITWRVTLDRDGQALVYDSMHNCGCYHLFFPTDRLFRSNTESSGSDELEEAILVPQHVATLKAGQRMHLYVTAGSHDLVRVRAQAVSTDIERYVLHDYDELRRLPGSDGYTNSLFDSQGLVPGSERLESVYLWPMGVLRPGAMRQWGHHATAFVGRRHFDQSDLMERYFVRRKQN